MYRVFNGTVPQYVAELTVRRDYVVPRTYKRLADSSCSVARPTACMELLALLLTFLLVTEEALGTG